MEKESKKSNLHDQFPKIQCTADEQGKDLKANRKITYTMIP